MKNWDQKILEKQCENFKIGSRKFEICLAKAPGSKYHGLRKAWPTDAVCDSQVFRTTHPQRYHGLDPDQSCDITCRYKALNAGVALL